MEDLSSQSAYLINALQYCHFPNAITGKLIIKLCKKLEVCPQLFAKQLLDQVNLINNNNSDPGKAIEFLNSGLSKALPISNKLKKRIALKLRIEASKIHQ